ncbi:MAG: GNAT family N-acetyltransferase [Actinobacteria bacterium]|nr:GNAT family N-acetyltransferase [Actinomycetota bacterium]
MAQSITDFDLASEFLQKNERVLILFKTWVPRDKFMELLYNEGGISMYREDHTPIAFSVGSNPPVKDSWPRINFERGAKGINEIQTKERSDWQTYFLQIKERKIEGLNTVQFTDEEIDTFLKLHAPKSSVFPGNKEIVKWACVSHEVQLAGVAAIARWESGEHVVASVAVHSDLRGLGIGAKLMKEVVRVALSEGLKTLCLGVNSDNLSAIALYEKLNWQPLYKFTYVERA